MPSRKHTPVPRKKSKDYHGFCIVHEVSEEAAQLRSVNLEIEFMEALRLQLALQSALMQMNTYHRGSGDGRHIRIQLSYKTSNNSLSVNEVLVPEGRR